MMGFCRAGHEGSDYTVQMSLFMVASGTLGLAGGAIAEWLGAPLFFLTMGGLALLCLGWVARAMRVSSASTSVQSINRISRIFHHQCNAMFPRFDIGLV
jgi:hypothetical protein